MNRRRSTPFEHAYWVIPGKFLAGYYPGAEHKREARRKLAALLEHGIRQIINLMEPHELDWYGNLFVPYEQLIREIAQNLGVLVYVKRVSIRDASIPTRGRMINILNLIDQSIAENRPVYLHCLGGLGRTGTVVGCYLARHGIASGEEALAKIQELRKDVANRNSPSPQFPDQANLVRSWGLGE